MYICLFKYMWSDFECLDRVLERKLWSYVPEFAAFLTVQGYVAMTMQLLVYNIYPRAGFLDMLNIVA